MPKADTDQRSSISYSWLRCQGRLSSFYANQQQQASASAVLALAACSLQYIEFI